jgi:NAD-dependent deacetylase
MTDIVDNAALEEAASLIRKSKYVVVFTGAGVSTPSGIPDFRSAHSGLWTKDNPMEVASFSAFRYRPEKFFNWLRPLARNIIQAVPNSAHYGLAKLEHAGYIKSIITQNIDGLHQKAGSTNVIEVHGSMTRLECLRCRRSFPSEDFIDSFINREEIPHCDRCRKILKPCITLFEEMLPEKAWNQAEAACNLADLVLVVGSSLSVTPAAYLPVYAVENNARLIINNLTPTQLDYRAEVLLPWNAVDVIPKIINLLNA